MSGGRIRAVATVRVHSAVSPVFRKTTLPPAVHSADPEAVAVASATGLPGRADRIEAHPEGVIVMNASRTAGHGIPKAGISANAVPPADRQADGSAATALMKAKSVLFPGEVRLVRALVFPIAGKAHADVHRVGTMMVNGRSAAAKKDASPLIMVNRSGLPPVAASRVRKVRSVRLQHPRVREEPSGMPQKLKNQTISSA